MFTGFHGPGKQRCCWFHHLFFSTKTSNPVAKKKVLSHVFQVTVNTPPKKANEYPLKIDFVGSDDSFPFRMVPLKKGRIRSFVVGVP